MMVMWLVAPLSRTTVAEQLPRNITLVATGPASIVGSPLTLGDSLQTPETWTCKLRAHVVRRGLGALFHSTFWKNKFKLLACQFLSW